MPKPKAVHRRTHTHNGKTIDRTFPTKALADEWKAMMVKRSARVKAGLPLAAEEVPFKVAAARYVLLRKSTSDYWKFEEAKFRRVFVPKLGERNVRSISKADVESVLHGARLDQSMKAGTFNRYRACLHTFFEHLIDEGQMEYNPVTKVKPMKESKRGVYVSDQQVEVYITEARKEQAQYYVPLIILAMNAGPRPGELLGFRWSDYDEGKPLHQMVIARRYQVALGKEKEGTKGRGERAIPLNEIVIKVLERWRSVTPHKKPEDFIFHRPDGQRASAHTINDIHRRVAKRAGLPDSVRLYDLTRHKYGSEVTKRLGLRAAQLLLGHVSSQTTERYAHHDPQHLINQALDVKVGDVENE